MNGFWERKGFKTLEFERLKIIEKIFFSRKRKIMMTVLGERNQDGGTKNLFMGPTSNLNFKKNLLAQLTPLTWVQSALKISCILNDQITLSSEELQCDL